MRKKVIAIFILVSVLILGFAFTTVVQAEEINTDKYKDIYNSDKIKANNINDLTGKVLGVVQVVGVATGIVMLIVIGIKYMLTSVEEKAAIKQRLIPYVIGAVLLFGGTGLLTIIVNLVREFK